ncbi:MAG: TonB-dependent receptor [Candidatus Nitrotoga sp.]
MEARSNKASFIALSLLFMAVNQTVQASHAIPTEDTVSEQLPEITVTADPGGTGATPPIVKKYKFPQTTESTTAKKIADTVNIVDTEDAVKYMPSIFVRKRNYGDTQPVMATRTWGVNSSARSLVYADDVLLSALIANNNTIGAPRWGMVAPEEIQRIDIMYGPFAAAYPGNSMGAVMQITTRMPDKFEGSISQTMAFQNFQQYNTSDTYRTSQTAATFGNRSGNLSWWISANHMDSNSQPLTYITQGQAAAEPVAPANTTGRITANNKIGLFADVLGAGGLLHTQMDNAKVKVAYDLTPALRATYTFGYWRNNAQSNVQTYLTSTAPATIGQATFGGVAGFASSIYDLIQEHTMQSLALKSDTKGIFDWEAVVTDYRISRDKQSTPSGVGTLTTVSTTGKTSLMDGTGWSSVDLKGIWRPGGNHEISSGIHNDQYSLDNPVFNTFNWTIPNSFNTPFTISRGKTQTNALWVQDVWKILPALKATLGGRYENWKAYDGYNLNGATEVFQPKVTSTNFSPKASLSWVASADWVITNSFGQAYRYPTVSELFQSVNTGPTVTIPNPNLRPEKVLSDELVFERALQDGKFRVSLFREEVSNAIISQTSPLVSGSGIPFTFTMNVDKIRNQGIELAMQKDNAFMHGLELSGSVTYVDSTILANSNWKSPAAPAPQNTISAGKRAPYVPDWRATLVATYRPDMKWAYTLAGRYSGKQYSTMDNTDNTSNVYGAFDSFVVIDARANFKVNKNWNASMGIDNINNYKYTLFHPFPQRTFVANLKYKF